MEIAVYVLMTMVCFGFLLKYTFSGWKTICVVAMLCALFVALMWPVAIVQSRNQIADWLSSPDIMRNTSALVCIDAALTMWFCIMEVNVEVRAHMPRWRILLYDALRCFPGFMIFAVFFSLLVGLVFNMPGGDFRTISYLAGLGVAILMPALVSGVKLMLPERDIRLEMLFLVSALSAMLGIVITVNGSTAAAGVDKIDWPATAAMLALAVAGGAVGVLLRNLKLRKINRNNNN